MRAKILTLSVFSIFIVAMLAVFVSAATSNLNNSGVFEISNVNAPDTISQTVGSFAITFDINNTGSVDHTVSWVASTVSGGSSSLSFSPTESSNFVVGTPTSVTVTVTFDNNFEGTITGTISADPSGSSSASTFDFSTQITAPQTEPSEVTACKNIGNPGDLKVKDIDFNNLGILIFQESSGDIYLEFGDDDEWFPLDDLEIEIEIENNGDEDVDDIEVEWGLYNTKRNEMVIDFDEEDEVNIKDGDDEIIDAEFNLEDELDVDLDDLDDGKHYRFYVIATGEVDNVTADRTCAFDFQDVEIVIENDFVVLNDVQYPETVQCGETVQISAKVWNVGEDDQDEVKVEVHNNDLGLFHRTVEIGDVDAFDDDIYNFNFKVPNDAEEKTHSLSFQVLDEDFDVYENDFDDDESEFTLPFRVSGGCVGVMEKGVSVSANLESGGKAGEQLVVRATVTNNDDESKVFTVNAAGFSQWASSYTADRTSLVLGAGDSADVRFTFDVNKDALGSQSFTIELVSEDNQVTTQPVSVLIEGKRSLFGLTGAVTSGNAYLWGIAILNVILVLAIIVVAVRVLKK